MTFLTYAEFKAKHRVKYDKEKLSNAQIKARYENYKKSYAANGNNPKYAKKAQNTTSGRISYPVPPKIPGNYPSKNGYPPNYFEGGHLKSGHLAPGVNMSNPSTKYFMALTDPFDPRIQKVGYPDCSGAVSTMKKRVFVKGTFTCSTAAGAEGTGYVAFSPLGAAVNSVDCTSYSLAGYSENDKFPSSLGALAGERAQSKSNTTIGALDGLFARVVAAGLRCQPVNAAKDTSGLVATICMPGGQDITDLGLNQMLTDYWKASQVHSNTAESNRWFSSIWSPTSPSHYMNFKSGSSAITARPNAASVFVETSNIAGTYTDCLGILISGAVAGNEYYFEGYAHVEYFTGVNVTSSSNGNAQQVRQNGTPAFSDPDAVALSDTTTGVNLNAEEKSGSSGAISPGAVASWLGSAAKNISSFTSTASSIGSSLGMSTQESISAMGTSSAAASIEDIGGFLPTSELADTGPIVEMLGEGGEWLELAPMLLV
jgi:hypothetical protein